MNGDGPLSWRDVYAVAERIETKLDAHAEKTDRRLNSLEVWRGSVQTAGGLARAVWIIAAGVASGAGAGLLVALVKGA